MAHPIEIFFVSSHKSQSRLSDRKWKAGEIVCCIFAAINKTAATVARVCASLEKIIRENQK
jgi:hypothetical protein